MNFKVDENLPLEIASLLTEAGHFAVTVLDQSLGGSIDSKVMTICVEENRALVTIDLDFSNIRAYSPQSLPGIIVLRAPDQSKLSLINLSQQFIPLLEREPLKGRLWIVEPGKVRIRGDQDE